jgi:hypothetical protein
MKPIFLVLLLVIGMSAFGDTIACVPDTASNYQAQGSCTEDPFILKNFSWNGGFGTVPVPASHVYLVPQAGGGLFGLNFQGVPGMPNPFSITGDQTIDALFAYTIDPRPPILNGMTVTITPTTASSAPLRGLAADGAVPFANITTFVCAGDTFADSCDHGTNLKLVVDTRTVLTTNVDFPTPVNVVDILMELTMQANGGSIAIIGGGTAAQAAVPEPGSAVLALSGLAALIGLGVRRSRA